MLEILEMSVDCLVTLSHVETVVHSDMKVHICPVYNGDKSLDFYHQFDKQPAWDPMERIELQSKE